MPCNTAEAAYMVRNKKQNQCGHVYQKKIMYLKRMAKNFFENNMIS